MYHEVSIDTRARLRRRRIAVFLAVALVAVAAVFGYSRMRASMREQAAMSLRQSIMDAAMQCCAVEGSFPMQLSYLEENYGLTINHNDYVITYQAYANNVAPSVVVMPR